ncbi:MAG: glycosyltransferase family 2 protein [Patescibacteria group bacterium]
MITYNSVEVVEGALKSVAGLWDELLVGDGGSTDGTVEMVKKYGGRVQGLDSRLRGNDNNGGMTKKNLGERKQELVEKAKGDWLLVLDADERVSEELRQEIKVLIGGKRRLDSRLRGNDRKGSGNDRKGSGNDNNCIAYRIPYQNYVFGRTVYFGGEKYAKVRLFKKGFARISPDALHEEVIVKDGKVGELKGVIHHHSYRTPWQLFTKFTKYAWMTAGMDSRLRGNDDLLEKLFLYGPHMVWARFVKEKEYKDGWRGMVLALAFGYMEGLTYWFLLFRALTILPRSR